MGKPTNFLWQFSSKRREQNTAGTRRVFVPQMERLHPGRRVPMETTFQIEIPKWRLLKCHEKLRWISYQRSQINKGGYHNNVHLIFPWYSYDFHWFSIFFHTFPLISVDTTTTCTFPQIFPIVFRMNFFCPQVDITTTCTGIRTSFTPGIPQTAAGWLRPSSGSVERSSGTVRWPGLALRSVVSGLGISPWGKKNRGGWFSRWFSVMNSGEEWWDQHGGFVFFL